jgi:TatD DNase family protein
MSRRNPDPLQLPGCIDTHAHLTAPRFAGQVDEVLERARAAGLRAIISIGPGYGLAGNADAVALAEREPDVWAAVGLHPHDAAMWNDEARASITAQLGHPRVVAVGEGGLDAVYRKPETHAAERASFIGQCELAVEFGKPLVVHTRDDFAETLAILRAHGIGRTVGGVIHFFAVDLAQAEAYLDLGLHLSVPGVVTLPNAPELAAAVPHLPLDRLMLETDSPYAAPIPFRGRRNEPGYVVYVAARIAELMGIAPDEVVRTTSANAVRFFGLPAAVLG